MSTAEPLTEPAIANQNRAADDSERVPAHGRDWLFLLVSAGIAALLAIGTSLVSEFAGDSFWSYVASAACAVVAFFLLFLGFLRLRGSIRDAIAGSFLLGYLWLLSHSFFQVYAMGFFRTDPGSLCSSNSPSLLGLLWPFTSPPVAR